MPKILTFLRILIFFQIFQQTDPKPAYAFGQYHKPIIKPKPIPIGLKPSPKPYLASNTNIKKPPGVTSGWAKYTLPSWLKLVSPSAKPNKLPPKPYKPIPPTPKPIKNYAVKTTLSPPTKPKTDGYDDEHYDRDIIRNVRNPRACCFAMTARCMACLKRKSIRDYCGGNPTYKGCY